MVLTESQKKLQIDDKAPAFELVGVDDKIYALDDFVGSKAMLIVFMCNHCPYVKSKLNSILKLHDQFKSKGVAVVGINSNDPDYHDEGFENMKKFAMERGIKFPYLFDETQDVAKAYGATCTPDSFLFDKDVKLVFHGRIDNALTLDQTPTEFTMANNITKILNGQKIDKTFESSMGCSIKWKGIEIE